MSRLLSNLENWYGGMNGIVPFKLIPDLLHPEQEGDFEAHAYQGYADMAKDARLRPGDRAVMRGTLQQQTVALENGATTIVNHFSVTFIEVLSRSKRVPASQRMKRGNRCELHLSLHRRVSSLFEDIGDRHINIGGLSGFALHLLCKSYYKHFFSHK